MTEWIAIALLVVVTITQLFILLHISALRSDVARWFDVWGRNDAHASDYHAKEIWKTLQEIAHMIAVERADRKEREGR